MTTVLGPFTLSVVCMTTDAMPSTTLGVFRRIAGCCQVDEMPYAWL